MLRRGDRVTACVLILWLRLLAVFRVRALAPSGQRYMYLAGGQALLQSRGRPQNEGLVLVSISKTRAGGGVLPLLWPVAGAGRGCSPGRTQSH